MRRLTMVVSLLFLWLFAANHCLLFATFHDCHVEDACAMADHGHDHCDTASEMECDSNCESLTLSTPASGQRDEQFLASLVDMIQLVFDDVPRDYLPLDVTFRVDERCQELSCRWQFITRAALLPGEPSWI